MIFTSNYTIEFSKSKEEVLKNIKNSIFVGFPDFGGKVFKGKALDNGFKIRLMEKYLPTFKGDFIADNNFYSLKLSAGLDVYQVLSILFFLSFSICMIVRNLHGDYYVSVAYLIVVGFFIYTTYRRSKTGKKMFFDYLKNFDNNCKIIPLK